MERAPARTLRSGKKKGAWQCRCDCGATKVVLAAALLSGNTLSCGCLGIENRRRARTKHGGCGHRGAERCSLLYVTWRSMRRRCHAVSDTAFPNYGGRGIYVCTRWRDDFAAFREDMGERPSLAHSIDRIDNEGSYTCGKCDECREKGAPMNCRWADRKTQSRNTRQNRMIEYSGETMCLNDWAARYGMPRECLRGRLNMGWPIERALTAPRRLRPRRSAAARNAPCQRP